MIERLSIKNYAIIDSIALDFTKGFHVFTGETGAGKSIIVGALGLILGGRADTTVIRSGSDKTVIEAEFSIGNPYTLKQLTELGVEEPGTLILRREISDSGKSRAFINGLQEPISKLADIGQWLVDIHGQHDHQLLLNQKVHIDILDAYGSLEHDREKVAGIYSILMDMLKQKEELESDESRLEQEKVFWETAVDEITGAALAEGEEEELKHQMERMEYAERIKTALDDAYKRLYEDELAASGRLARSISDLATIGEIDPKYAELMEILEDAAAKVDESVNLLSGYRDEMNIDESSIDEITDRLTLIKDLQRKFRKNSVKDLLEYAEECAAKLSRFSNRAEELERLNSEIEMVKQNLANASLELSRKRQTAANGMAERVKDELSYLGMDKSEFVVNINYVRDEDSILSIQGKNIKVGKDGIDRVEFLISTNVGQEAKPLRKVASGGEISRVMLALKAMLADNDSIDTLIFDEIDVGIGGVTANHVAEKMKEISSSKQLIVITHLAQIASKANRHYLVAKMAEAGMTKTFVNTLEGASRTEEIARMLGGESDTAIAHAREMLGV